MLSERYLNILSQVKAKEILLSAIDLVNFGIILDGIYFYKNEGNEPDFMSIEKLKLSFCKLVVDHYPIVVGRPTLNKEGQASIKVDPGNLNVPDILELNVSYPAETFFETRPSDIEDNPDVVFFNTRKFYQVSKIKQLPKATYRRDNSAAVIRVIRFKDSSYVAFTFCLPHAIFDGISAIAFINHWAEYARNITDVDAGTYQLTNPPLMDRQIVKNAMEGIDMLEVPFVEYFKKNALPIPIELPENPAGVLISTPDIPANEEQHMIHFSSKTLNRMRNDIDPSHTTNTILAAFIAKNMLLANIEIFGAAPQISFIAIAYDCRLRSDISQQFSGNASPAAIAPIPSQSILDGTYQDLANSFKEYGSKIESGHTKSIIDVLENNMELMYQVGISLCNSPTSSFAGMTNVRYMPFYTIDFGYGKPSVLGFDYFMREGMIRVLPNSQDGGVDLVINFRDEFFEKLCGLEDIK
ncbi:hypothetical protein J3B02_002565, partial [Coemansia erecta]